MIKTITFLAACAVGLSNFSFGQMTDNKNTGTTKTAVFGGGCFWCLDAQFKLLDGVKKVTSGYAGGTTKNPTYEQVCSDGTGHAEVIKVEFDPSRISYADLLRKFFLAHDPTTLNRQGPDAGTQYRSIVLYGDDTQKVVAEQVKAEAQKSLPDPIVTQIVPLEEFYAAEDYHQDYFAKNPQAGYCRLVVAPKVRKFEKELEKEKGEAQR
jgi:peptide-methionine (S)-S-oxide reductase